MRTGNIAKLKSEVEHKLGRALTSPSDYDLLSMAVSEELHDSISSSTLKRMFGYIESTSSPSLSSLNIMARYIGYISWKDFMAKKQQEVGDIPLEQSSTASSSHIDGLRFDDSEKSTVKFLRQRKWLGISVFAFFVVVVAVVYNIGRYQKDEASKDIKTSKLARPKDMNDPKNVELFRRGDLLYRRWFKSKAAVTVECVNKNVESMVIPDSVLYNDSMYHVAELSFDCFRDCKRLKYVRLEGGDRHFQNGIFKGCDNLQVISIMSNIPPRIGNGGWPASIPEIFDEHHFDDVTLYLTPYLYEHLNEFPAWGEFTHKELRNPAPPKCKK